MATTLSSATEVCGRARAAARILAGVDTATKNAALCAIAQALRDRAEEILAANELDLQVGREADIGAALLDRLHLDPARLDGERGADLHHLRRRGGAGEFRLVGTGFEREDRSRLVFSRKCLCALAGIP